MMTCCLALAFETGTWEPLCQAYRAAGRMKDFAAVVDRIKLPPARAIVNLVAAQELLGIDIFNPSEIPEP